MLFIILSSFVVGFYLSFYFLCYRDEVVIWQHHGYGDEEEEIGSTFESWALKEEEGYCLRTTLVSVEVYRCKGGGRIKAWNLRCLSIRSRGLHLAGVASGPSSKDDRPSFEPIIQKKTSISTSQWRGQGHPRSATGQTSWPWRASRALPLPSSCSITTTWSL